VRPYLRYWSFGIGQGIPLEREQAEGRRQPASCPCYPRFDRVRSRELEFSSHAFHVLSEESCLSRPASRLVILFPMICWPQLYLHVASLRFTSPDFSWAKEPYHACLWHVSLHVSLHVQRAWKQMRRRHQARQVQQLRSAT
jgi:hypothetical protein